MALKVERTSPTSLVVTRAFAAPPALVWKAHTDPALIQRWCLGPDGWEMPLCEMNPIPGGSFRYEFKEVATGNGFAITGKIEVVEAPHRMVHIETMHLPDPTPPARIETRFEATDTGTRMVMTMEVEEAASMDAMVATGMTDGMEQTYSRLDGML